MFTYLLTATPVLAELGGRVSESEAWRSVGHCCNSSSGRVGREGVGKRGLEQCGSLLQQQFWQSWEGGCRKARLGAVWVIAATAVLAELGGRVSESEAWSSVGHCCNSSSGRVGREGVGKRGLEQCGSLLQQQFWQSWEGGCRKARLGAVWVIAATAVLAELGGRVSESEAWSSVGHCCNSSSGRVGREGVGKRGLEQCGSLLQQQFWQSWEGGCRKARLGAVWVIAATAVLAELRGRVSESEAWSSVGHCCNSSSGRIGREGVGKRGLEQCGSLLQQQFWQSWEGGCRKARLGAVWVIAASDAESGNGKL